MIYENLQLVLSDEMVAAIQPLQFTPAQVHAGVLGSLLSNSHCKPHINGPYYLLKICLGSQCDDRLNEGIWNTNLSHRRVTPIKRPRYILLQQTIS